MRWTCPKCGKKLDVSDEQLLAQDGVIVCPQCLLQSQQPLPRVTLRANKNNSTPPARARKSSATPPPYTATSRSTTSSTTSSTPPRRTTTTKRKKSKKKRSKTHTSALGCFFKSIAFTLLLFAAYVFVGLILQSLG